jgi:hypothetical protein
VRAVLAVRASPRPVLVRRQRAHLADTFVLVGGDVPAGRQLIKNLDGGRTGPTIAYGFG